MHHQPHVSQCMHARIMLVTTCSEINKKCMEIVTGFIDGDLMEKFLDLKQSQMEDICKGIKVGFLVLV